MRYRAAFLQNQTLFESSGPLCISQELLPQKQVELLPESVHGENSGQSYSSFHNSSMSILNCSLALSRYEPENSDRNRVRHSDMDLVIC